MPIQFEKTGLALSYFSTVTTLGTPQDALLQEIRLESFFPADETTAAHSWQGDREAKRGKNPEQPTQSPHPG